MANNLSVSVTADTADLRAKLAVAQADLRAFNSETKALADQFRAAGADAKDQFLPQLQAAADAAAHAKEQVSELKNELSAGRGQSTMFEELKEKAEAFHSSLGIALAGGEFLVFRELAEQAFEAVKILFEQTVEKAIEFDLSTAKFAAEMGIAADQAAGLSESLKAVGSSADQYLMMSLRLDRQIKTNEAGLIALGMTTRDQNHNLLSQTELMRNAVATMGEYKSGSDQNTVAQQFFSRAAKDVYDIMLVTDEMQQHFAEHLAEMGGSTMPEAANNALALKISIATLNATFEDFGIAIGQRIGPEFKEMIDFINSIAMPALNTLRIALQGVAIVLDTGFTGISQLLQALWGTLMEVAQAALGVSRILSDLATGKFGAIKGDWDGTMLAMKDRWNKTLDDMTDTGLKFQARMEDLVKGPQGGGKSLYASGDKNAPAPDVKLDTVKKGPIHALIKPINDGTLDRALKSSEEQFKRTFKTLNKGSQELVDMQKARWKSFLDPVVSAFDTSIKGIIAGTQTLGQAMSNIAESIALSFLNAGLKMAEDWIINLLVGKAASVSTGLSEIATNAAVAASGAYAATALIPYVGPALAPAAAQTAYYGAMSYGIAASAAGGFDIPAGVNPVTQLHEKEMVLPASIADGVRNNLGGGGGGFNPTVNIHVGPGANPGAISDNVKRALKDLHRTFQINKKQFA